MPSMEHHDLTVMQQKGGSKPVGDDLVSHFSNCKPPDSIQWRRWRGNLATTCLPLRRGQLPFQQLKQSRGPVPCRVVPAWRGVALRADRRARQDPLHQLAGHRRVADRLSSGRRRPVRHESMYYAWLLGNRSWRHTAQSPGRRRLPTETADETDENGPRAGIKLS